MGGNGREEIPRQHGSLFLEVGRVVEQKEQSIHHTPILQIHLFTPQSEKVHILSHRTSGPLKIRDVVR